jgi:hypothetical protein
MKRIEMASDIANRLLSAVVALQKAVGIFA